MTQRLEQHRVTNLQRFYVYEHWSPGEDAPFYVGKGQNGTARQFTRNNKQYKNVMAKLADLKLRPEARIVADNLPEEEAFSLEKERIKFWRDSGVTLTNATAGGDGARWAAKRTAEQIVRVLLTDTEKRELQAAAERAGAPLAVYVRMMALAAARAKKAD